MTATESSSFAMPWMAGTRLRCMWAPSRRAFNHVTEAEKSLNQAIRDASTKEEANEAREWLMGRKSTRRVSQIGGSSERDVIVLPEARLHVGGLDAVLRPANIFSPPIGNDMYHGNLGMDVLSQAAAVTIDFQSMSLTLR
jgi:hypothetical protein